MATVVFLRAVNVGGHKAFRPSELVRVLAELDVTSIGAAGTFIVRAGTGVAEVRERFLEHLSFEATMMVCRAVEIVDLIGANPFARTSPVAGTKPYVSVVEKPLRRL